MRRKDKLRPELWKSALAPLTIIALFACAAPRPAPPKTVSATATGVSGSSETAISPPVSISTITVAVPVKLVPQDQWPAIKDELDKKSLLKSAQKSLAYLQDLPPENHKFRLGDQEYSPGMLIDSLKTLLRIVSESQTPEELNNALKTEFDLYQSLGSDGAGKVVFSSYYQPVVSATLNRTSRFRYPIYRKPRDMVEADLGQFNPKYKGETILGRVTKDRQFVPYFDRHDIDVRKALSGRGLEVAWFESQFDRLDLHVQGSGILKLPNGKMMLAKYAATNSLPYKSVGTVVLGSGAMTRSEINHERLRQYLDSHPEGESWLISQNPRYTFFDLVPLPKDGEPFGTIQQSLVPGRSIAIDPKIFPLGAVAFLQAPMPQADKDGNLLGVFPTSRLVMCQDTGGAIQGPGRVDIYIGHGSQAKTSAVNQWSEGKLYILLKKLPPRDR